jgi:hypothetical protein
LLMDELTGKHSDEHDTNDVRAAHRPRANHATDRTRSQVSWLSGQRLGCIGWSRHPPSIVDLWPLWLLIW